MLYFSRLRRIRPLEITFFRSKTRIFRACGAPKISPNQRPALINCDFGCKKHIFFALRRAKFTNKTDLPLEIAIFELKNSSFLARQFLLQYFGSTHIRHA